MSRNIISISCLDLDGYSFVIKNNKIIIHRNVIYYGNVILDSGFYILDLNNNKSIYNIDTKRVKSDELNPTYFWHCRL